MPSTRLSISAVPTRRARLSPRATRIASSRCRASARARKRLATLAQAISSRKPTAPSRIQSIAWMSPTTNSRSGSICGRNPALTRIGAAPSSGNSSTRFDARPASSACSRSAEWSAPRRASPRQQKFPSWTSFSSRWCGCQSCVSGVGNVSVAGITPTISTRSPSISTTRPMTPVSPPKRACQSPSLRTVTGGAPGRPSSAVKTRPSRGGVRTTSKNDGVTKADSTRCGFSAPVKLAWCSLTSATPSRVRTSLA